MGLSSVAFSWTINLRISLNRQFNPNGWGYLSSGTDKHLFWDIFKTFWTFRLSTEVGCKSSTAKLSQFLSNLFLVSVQIEESDWTEASKMLLLSFPLRVNHALFARRPTIGRSAGRPDKQTDKQTNKQQSDSSTRDEKERFLHSWLLKEMGNWKRERGVRRVSTFNWRIEWRALPFMEARL